MPTLIVENVPGDIYEQIQQQARAGNRTLSEETVWLLRKGLRPHEAAPNESVLSEPPAAEQVTSSVRLPSPSDFILDTGEISAPFDLPRPGVAVQVPTRPGGIRLPDPFVETAEDDSNHDV